MSLCKVLIQFFPFLFSALLIAPEVASAQETINYASVGGRLTDPSGAVVEGAAVTARQTDTNQKNIAKTDREGRFRFPHLKGRSVRDLCQAARFRAGETFAGADAGLSLRAASLTGARIGAIRYHCLGGKIGRAHV